MNNNRNLITRNRFQSLTLDFINQKSPVYDEHDSMDDRQSPSPNPNRRPSNTPNHRTSTKSDIQRIFNEYELKQNSFNPSKKLSPNLFIKKLQTRMHVYYKLLDKQ
jgi:hypothetical protein